MNKEIQIEKQNINDQIRALNLEKKVTIIPHIDNVIEILPDFDLFLQGSFVEGFPNATMESCAMGTPVIAFNAPGGTKEIITNNVNGFIANSNEDFLDYLVTSLTVKKWNRSNISDSIIEKFESKKIISEYERVFLNVLNQKN